MNFKQYKSTTCPRCKIDNPMVTSWRHHYDQEFKNITTTAFAVDEIIYWCCKYYRVDLVCPQNIKHNGSWNEISSEFYTSLEEQFLYSLFRDN